MAFSLCAFSLWGQEGLQDLPELMMVPESSHEEGRFMAEFWKVLMALGGMIAALFFLSWSAKKLLQSQVEQTNETNAIKVIQKRPLSTKTTVYLLEIEGRSVVMAESTNGVTLLQSSTRKEPFNLMDVKS